MRLIRGQTSISVPKNNFRFSGKPRQPTPRQDQNRSHVQFPQSAHTESKELAPTFLRREVARLDHRRSRFKVMGAIWKVVPCGHGIIESGKNKSVTASCSRTFGKEGHTLAIEWEISCFLT